MNEAVGARRTPRIVAIDDDPLIRRLLESFFAEKGYTLITAADGPTYRCRKWYRQCEAGYDYACEKFERRGC